VRIMVAEDEPPILRDICSQIQAAGSEYSIVARVVDGGMAIEAVRAGLVPDLVITDIRMPVVDGIALAEWLRAEHPQVQVVMLSGYKDFEYARSALRLGVADYLLKPVAPSDLSSLLRKIAERLAERRNDAWYRAIEDAWHGTAPADGRCSSRDFILVAIAAGTLSDSGEEFFLPGAAFWERIDLGSRLDELTGLGRLWIGEGQSSNEKIVMIDLDGNPQGWLDSTIVALYDSLVSLGSPICMAAYRKPQDLSRLRQGYAALRRELSHRAVIGRSCLAMVTGFERQEPAAAEIGYDTKRESLIDRAAASGNPELIAAELMGLLRSWKDVGLSQVMTERYLKTLLTHLEGTAGKRDGRAFDIDQEIGLAIARALSFEDLAAPLANLISALFSSWPQPCDAHEDLIGEAEAFLRGHYTEAINGEQLSRKIGIVPSYLSKLFKKRTGLSPPEFLIHLRVERACELLDNGDRILIKDVARAVGYEDPNHFSRIFHKASGYWPSEYKARPKAGKEGNE
jgi:two-component system response regulator YesN